MKRSLKRFLTVAFPVTLTCLLTVQALVAAEPATTGPAKAESAKSEVLPPIDTRFADPDVSEVPGFQRHVVPLFGRLGCNARACHGSFQGQGGFQLSLFGYDFKFDHESLTDKENPRVNPENPLKSLIIEKPTDEDNHEGGERYAKNSWEYNVIRNWIREGASFESTQILTTLDVSPKEIVFSTPGDTFQLRAVAVWNDGTREDVTTLCRFDTNDDQVCTIDENGKITGNEAGDSHVVISYDKAVVPIPVMRAFSDKVGENYPTVATKTKVDELVVDKLRKLGIVPSEVCTDAEFLRRVQLDLTGTLPTAEQVSDFLADQSSEKRSLKIEELLESPAYAAWWTTKLCDFTGNNDQQLQNVLPPMSRDKNNRYAGNPASKAWYDWIHERIIRNAPYDEIAEGIVTATSVSDGQSYRDYCEEMCSIYRGEDGKTFGEMESMPYYWARRDFRQVEPRVISFAHAFMGIRIQCAQCHKHPFDQWSKEDFAEFSGFFRDTQASNNRPPDEFRDEYTKIVEELNVGKSLKGNEFRKAITKKLNEGVTIPFNVVYVNQPKPANNKNRNKKGKNGTEQKPPKRTATLLGAEMVDLTSHSDPREPLMEWLRSPDNPYFSKAFVNRVWATYFNRGIVESPDDMSLANPPVNEALLNYLAEAFRENDFDIKWVHRTILNSDTYQRSWKSNETNAGDLKNFSHAVPRRLPAEVVYDAVVAATVSDEVADKLQKDLTDRAISIPGSNGQNRNYAGQATFALTVFGRSTRESSCDCDRAMDPSLLQTVFLQNDQQIHQLISAKNGWIQQLSSTYQPDRNDSASRGRPENYDKSVANLRKQINRLKESGKNPKGLIAAEKRLADYEKKYRVKKTQPVQPAVTFDAEKTISQAYLRTLSRLPNEDELNRCREFVTVAENPVDAMQDILWALINTKEFVVNH